MNRSILGRAAFSAAVVLALGFGAREAFGSASAAARRPYCYYKWECQDWCDRAYGPGVTEGECYPTGCYCYYL